MKVIKGFAGAIISLILIASLCGVMCSVSINNATSSDTIRMAIEKTNAVDQLTERIMEAVPYDLGDSFQTALETVLKSEPMMDYYTSYLEGAAKKVISDGEIPPIDEEELTEAFEEGFQALEDSGDLEIPKAVKYLLSIAGDPIAYLASMCVGAVVDDVDMGSLDDNALKAIDMLQLFTNSEFRLLSGIIAILACISLIILFLGKGAWMRWIGMDGLLCGGMFYITSTMFKVMSDNDSGEASDIISRLITYMLHEGTYYVALTGLILGGGLFIAGVIYRVIRIFV